jgi:hypothetical protein
MHAFDPCASKPLIVRLFGPAGDKNQPNSDSKISWLEEFQSGTNTSCQSGTGKNQAASF